jgi:hypothetical protein
VVRPDAAKSPVPSGAGEIYVRADGRPRRKRSSGQSPCPTAGGVALRKPELAALFYKVNQGTDLRRIFDLRYLLSEKNMLIDCLAHC